jgi:hypothetical protein
MEQMNKEQERLVTSEKAIFNLTDTINHAKKVLTRYQSNLRRLKEISMDLLELALDERLDMQDEIETNKSCGRLGIYIGKSLERGETSTSNEIKLISQEIEELSKQIPPLEKDLADWKFIRNLTEDTILQLQVGMDSMKPGIEAAKMASSCRYDVPNEIWIAIFKYCLKMEVKEYLQVANTTILRPIPVILSLVCSNWRKIISQEPSLWSFITIYPCTRLTHLKADLFDLSVSRASKKLILISNLSSPVHWDTSDSNTAILPPSVLSLKRRYNFPGSCQHTLHLITNKDSYYQAKNIPAEPFRNTERLRLTIWSSRGSGNIWDLLDQFLHITQLEIYDQGSGFQELSGLSTRLPSLKYLKLQLDDVTLIDLTDRIPANLVELRLRHKGSITISPSSHAIPLPQLKVLGINYIETELLQILNVPALTAIEFYNSEHGYYNESSLVYGIRTILSRIRSLSFYDWAMHDDLEKLNDLVFPSGCASVACKELACLTSSLRNLRFVDCHMSGGPLVHMFETRSEKRSSLLALLESVYLVGCSGMTRSQCDSLFSLFPNINISEFLNLTSFTSISGFILIFRSNPF